MEEKNQEKILNLRNNQNLGNFFSKNTIDLRKNSSYFSKKKEEKAKEFFYFSESIKKKSSFFSFSTIFTSIFAVFLSIIFVGSGIIGAVSLKFWLPKVFYENILENKNSEKIFIPDFLFEEIDKSKEDPDVFDFQTKHLILRYEDFQENFVEGLGVPPTTTFDEFIRNLDRLNSENMTSVTIYDFLKSLFFKEKESKKNYSVILVGGYSGQYKAFQILKSKKIKATFFIPSEKIGKSGFLNWEEVREISDAGYEIGATGYEYLRMGGMKTGEQNFQIKESKKILTQKLEKEILLFYYPFGSYTADTLALVRNNEFVGGIGNGESINQDLAKSLELQTLYAKSYFG